MSVVVVGAGIIGLSSAVEIQKLAPSCKVILIAEHFSPNTTSDVAAGYWHPVWAKHEDENFMKHIGQVTFDHIRKLCREDSVKFGAGYQSGYELFKQKMETPYWADTVLNFRKVDRQEREKMGWFDFEDAFFYTTCYLEAGKYLEYLLKIFKNNNGVVIQRKLNSFQEIPKLINHEFDVLINASGLGAFWLCPDKSCFPIRGQVYKVKAPFQKHFVRSEGHYILLNNNQVILGGCYQENGWRTSVDELDSKKILDGCLKLVPSLKDCKVIDQYVGLRPGRPTLRLDQEKMVFDDKEKFVIQS